MRHFSFRPSITMKGRTNNGLRGLSGKPFHAPLTDVPIGAYVLVALFDLISLIAGVGPTGHAFFLVGTWTVLAGIVVSLGAALTGWADWHRTSEPGNQARRTINAHAIIMLSVTTLAIISFILRLTAFAGSDTEATPVGAFILSIVIALAIAWGATYGGSLVFDYGFNVETAGDHPVWHESEIDVFPGQHDEPAEPAGPSEPAEHDDPAESPAPALAPDTADAR